MRSLKKRKEVNQMKIKIGKMKKIIKQEKKKNELKVNEKNEETKNGGEIRI